MDAFHFEQLSSFLKKCELKSDEAEVLFVAESDLFGNVHDIDSSHLNQINQVSVLTSIIKDNILIRNSWMGSTFQAWLENQEMLLSNLKNFKGEHAIHSFSKDTSLTKINLNMPNQKDAFPIESIELCKNTVMQAYFGWNVDLEFQFNSKNCMYLNSYGIASNFQKSIAHVSYLVESEKNEVLKKGLFTIGNEPEKIVESIEVNLNQFETIVDQESMIKGGKSSVLLSPRVVEVLCKIITHHCKDILEFPTKLAKALPESFALEEDPDNVFSLLAVPFDDEGIKTQAKTLCQGQQRLNTLSDMKTAFRNKKNKSSGNGFRRGLFWKQMGDNTPGIHPSFLKLKPGTKTRKELLESVQDFVLINHVFVPFDRYQDLFSGNALVTLRGEYFRKNRLVSKIFAKNYSGRPLISSYPEAFGSLLDPTSMVLCEGEYCESGWFPYIFLPKFTWG